MKAKTEILKANSPKKNLTIQWDLLSTAQKTDGTRRGEHREKVEQNVVQDFLMNGPRLWQVMLFEKNRKHFGSSLIWSDLPRWPDKFKFFIRGGWLLIDVQQAQTNMLKGMPIDVQKAQRQGC